MNKADSRFKSSICESEFSHDIFNTVATPALGLSLSYEMRKDFVKFKFCETSLKLFDLIYIKPKEEAEHRTNPPVFVVAVAFCAQRFVLLGLNENSQTRSAEK